MGARKQTATANPRSKKSSDQLHQTAPVIRRHHALVLFALAALVVLAFSNSFQSGFILDNKGILLDPRLRAATVDNIGLIFRHTYWWPTGEAGLYRPLTTLSYLVNYAVLGNAADPAGYHWVNLFLHVANTWLAYALMLQLTRKVWPSLLTAALWSVHPVLTESVTNIVGRADLLAGMAVLSGLLMYLKSAGASGWARVLWLTGLAAVTTVGVFSKESAVAILPIIVLYDLLFSKMPWRRREFWFRCAATLVPIAVMLDRRSLVLAASRPAEYPFTDNPIVGANWWSGRLTAIKVMGDYLWLTIWPAKLSCDYSYNQIPLAQGTASDWLACAAVIALAIGAAVLFRFNRLCCFLLCFAFLNFLPASNLLFPIGTIMADRLLYLPSFGLVGCLVLAICAVAPASKHAFIARVLLCLLVIAFGVRTWIRNGNWTSELAIATTDVRVSPKSFKLHRLLASSLFESDPTRSNIDQVIAEQEKSLALLDPLPDAVNRPDAYRMAGYYYLVKSRHSQIRDPALSQKAIRTLSRSVAIDPENSQAELLLSVAYLESGDAEKALSPAIKAASLDPLNSQIYRQLSAVFSTEGDRSDAQIAAAVEDSITAIDGGKWQDALELTRGILKTNPNRYPVTFYLNAVANLRLDRLDAAESSAREAVRLDPAGRNPRSGYVLGLVLARKRQFGAAAELLNAYLKAEPAAADSDSARRQLREIERMNR